jgi:hypothetical protein
MRPGTNQSPLRVHGRQQEGLLERQFIKTENGLIKNHRAPCQIGELASFGVETALALRLQRTQNRQKLSPNNIKRFATG